MKNLLIVITLFIAIGVKAQTNNFYLDDYKISWQKNYETSKTKAEVIQHFENANIFKKHKVINDTIYGKLVPHETDPNKTGVAGVPQIINDTDFKGVVVIIVTDKEYQVIFSDIVNIGRGDFLKKNEEQALEITFLKRGKSEYTPGFLKKPRRIYDATFNEIFLIK